MNTPIEYRFYGRRKGKRLSTYRQELLDKLLPTLQPTDWQKTLMHMPFKKVALEIGFGKGEHLLYQAVNTPDTLFIGSDPFINSAGALLKGIAQAEISNIYLWIEDIRLLLKHLPLAVFDAIFILFPDPWPKKRHHKRRLIQNSFLDTLIPYIKPGAILTIATDHACYAAHIEAVFCQHRSFQTVSGFPCAHRPDPAQPITHYERKALKAASNEKDNSWSTESCDSSSSDVSEKELPFFRYFKYRFIPPTSAT